MSANLKLNQIYKIVQGIADFPQLIKDLEGEMVPYNVIRKIEWMMNAFPIPLASRAKALRDELEKTGYPKKEA